MYSKLTGIHIKVLKANICGSLSAVGMEKQCILAFLLRTRRDRLIDCFFGRDSVPTYHLAALRAFFCILLVLCFAFFVFCFFVFCFFGRDAVPTYHLAALGFSCVLICCFFVFCLFCFAFLDETLFQPITWQHWVRPGSHWSHSTQSPPCCSLTRPF